MPLHEVSHRRVVKLWLRAFGPPDVLLVFLIIPKIYKKYERLWI